METIDTNKVYYDFLNIDGEKRIRAYKVISIVFDIETELYTLTLNVAEKGVLTFRSKRWYFYTSPSDVVHKTACAVLLEILNNLTSNRHYVKNFLNQLKQQGFKVEGDGCVIRYYYFNGKVCWTEQVHIKKWCIDEPCIIGTYDLLTGEVKAEFNPRYKFSGGHTPYKSEKECLDAQMPEVVEFGDNAPKDVEISFDFNVTIKAKDAKEAQRKLSLMLQMTPSE